MYCKEVLSRLHAYMDREMPENLMREMERHLGSCPECRREAERIGKVGEILDGLSVPPIPYGFAGRVMKTARKRARVAKEKRFPSLPEWLPLGWIVDMTLPMRLAACALILLACLLGMFMSKELSVPGNHQTSAAGAENLDGFEWFSPTPPASLGSAYLTLALTETDDESTNR